MGFVNFLTYIKHLGEKALVFFPSKTDLITISSKDGEATEELLSERLETINNKIEKQNLLKNVAQYTKENPLVYTFNKNFSTTCTLEAGKWYSFSFDYVGELSRNNEIGFTNIDDSDNADIIDIINQSTIYDFYFQAKFSAEYNFYWNMLDENNENTKIYNLKVVEGYSPEMVRTVEEIKKIDKSKLGNVDNTADKDKFVAGLMDANDPNKTRHIYAYWAGSSGLTKDKVQYFTTFSAKDAKDSELRPLSLADTKTVLGVNDKQNITNGIVTGDVDWNTLTTAGAYKIEKCNMTEANHAPIGVHNYGILHVIVSGFNNETRISQIYIPDTVASDPTHGMRIRTQNVTNWAAWHILMTDADGVKKSGDTMTGNLTVPYIYSDGIAARTGGKHVVLKTIGADANGDSIIIGGGALVIVGSGESADALKTNLNIANNSEEMYISSDGNIHFYTNCQTITNKRHTYIDVNASYHGRGLVMEESSATFLRGVTGVSGINATTLAGFNCLAAGKTIAGRFGLATYELGDSTNTSGAMDVYYVSEQDVQASRNNCTYRARLLTDKGNTVFPGTVNAQKFSGTLMDLAPNDRYKLTHLPYNTEEIYNRIANEKWEDLPIGGYFTVTVNSSVGGSELIDFMIAHINPYTNRSSTPLTRPHVAIVPLNAFKTLAPMNEPQVELKDASSAIKTANHFIGIGGASLQSAYGSIDLPSGVSKFSVNDIVYTNGGTVHPPTTTSPSAHIEPGYYKVIKESNYSLNVSIASGYGDFTPSHTEYLGKTYKIGKGNTTAGGYVGSDMYTKTLPAYEAALKTIFGTHMLKFTTLLTTSVDMNVNSGAYPNQKGAANGWAWKDCYLRLMNEVQVYGTKAWGSSGYDVGEANFQLALFQHDPINMIAKQGNSGGRTNYWLSAVASGSSFCYCDGNVNSNCSYASNSLGVRPYFLLG